MPRPWEMTEEQVREEREALRERLRDADRQDSWLFAWQLARIASDDAPVSSDAGEGATDEDNDPTPAR